MVMLNLFNIVQFAHARQSKLATHIVMLNSFQHLSAVKY